MDKKIFFVINTLAGGGAERVISTLATEFHFKGFKVTVICLNSASSGYKLPLNLKTVSIVNRNSHNALFRIYYACITFINLYILLLSERPDVVISFMTSANIWTGLTSILSKTKFIVSERTNPEQSISNQNSFYRMLIQMIYKQAYALVLPAKGMEASIKKIFGFENLSNCRIIHNPVAQLEPSTKVKVNNRKFILGVGRLSFEKGFDRLIDAFANLNLKNIDLLIVGEGAEYAKLIQQIKDLKLQKHVKLIGLKSNVQDYYHQAELFVLPSRNEGYPNALIEAMSLGCPSVAIDCDFGPAEIIKHNQNGLLVPNNNINKLSASIYSVLMNPILKNRISINAKKINRSNSIERISKHWQQLI